jgi:hypothetical protein
MIAMKRAGLRKADWRLHLGCIEVAGKGLTPTHLFLQLEPSWFRNGQTTSLLESVMEKDDVKDDRGGILTPPALSRASERGWGGRLRAVGAAIRRSIVGGGGSVNDARQRCGVATAHCTEQDDLETRR